MIIRFFFFNSLIRANENLASGPSISYAISNIVRNLSFESFFNSYHCGVIQLRNVLLILLNFVHYSFANKQFWVVDQFIKPFLTLRKLTFHLCILQRILCCFFLLCYSFNSLFLTNYFKNRFIFNNRIRNSFTYLISNTCFIFNMIISSRCCSISSAVNSTLCPLEE